jgi:ParB family chromosome partitioning protein
VAKKGLGRGLDALLSEKQSGQAPVSGNAILQIAPDKLKPGKNQPRKRFNNESIKELAESLKFHGVIQPLVVEADTGDTYRIIAGERRWRAAKLAGLKTLPVLVRETGNENQLELALVENIQRENLNPVDEAEGYRQLMEIAGFTQEALAERMGKSRPAIANALRLLSLSGSALEALRSGTISAGHARALLTLPAGKDREQLLGKIINEGISVRDAENYSPGGSKKTAKKTKRKEKHSIADSNIAAIKQKLIDRLGTKVEIKGSLKRGQIMIEYYSMDDLDRVYEIMIGKK